MKPHSRLTATFAIAAVAMALLYFCAHISFVAISRLDWLELGAMALLIGCELFLIFQGFVYFLNVARVSAHERSAASEPEPELRTFPSIAVAMCSYREPLEVIEANMLCFRNLSYQQRQLYLLDDTRYDREPALAAYRSEVEALCQRMEVNLFRHEWRGAKAGLINDFLSFLAGREVKGLEFTAYQREPHVRDAKYLAVFDIDMNPLPDFVEPPLARLEADERIAFVQTPQFYSNTLGNRVAYGAALQQSIFYEYICEGKGLQNAMPCCGTNVVFSIAALEDIGGMDEDSVTEDFATSMKLHLRGWHSIYLNRICAFGMGPHDLGGFFRQQFRWASGMVGLFPAVVRALFRDPRSLSPMKWMEYLASTSYYCVAWVWLVIWLFPTVYIFTGFPRTLALPHISLMLFVPYFALTMGTFIGSLRHRGYQTSEVLASLAMNAISFPVYLKASACGLLGIRGSFKVTSKKGATTLPLHQLWPQLAALAVALLTIVWGLNHLFYGTLPLGAVLGNIVWSAYHGAFIATVLYYNGIDEPLETTVAGLTPQSD